MSGVHVLYCTQLLLNLSQYTSLEKEPPPTLDLVSEPYNRSAYHHAGFCVLVVLAIGVIRVCVRYFIWQYMYHILPAMRLPGNQLLQ